MEQGRVLLTQAPDSTCSPLGQPAGEQRPAVQTRSVLQSTVAAQLCPCVRQPSASSVAPSQSLL
jgi:hypothetical protein